MLKRTVADLLCVGQRTRTREEGLRTHSTPVGSPFAQWLVLCAHIAARVDAIVEIAGDIMPSETMSLYEDDLVRDAGGCLRSYKPIRDATDHDTLAH